MGNAESPRISVRLHKDVMAALRKREKKTGAKASQIVQDAVAQYLGVEAKPMQPGGLLHMSDKAAHDARSKGGKSRKKAT